MSSLCNVVNMRYFKDIFVIVIFIVGLGVFISDVEEIERICVFLVIVRFINKFFRVFR